MIFAHLPAAYLISRVIARRIGPEFRKPVIYTGLLAGIAPDFDLAWFYLIDNGYGSHHHYFTHLPFFWLAVCSAAAIVSLIGRQKKMFWCSISALINFEAHLALDSIYGKIAWLYPFSDWREPLLNLHSTYSRSSLNQMTSWTIMLEIAIIVAAAALLYLERQRRQNLHEIEERKWI
ncbi:MAG: metal-dependent hydrolase [Candidatus Rifleibacteriota bacterium]